MTEKQFRQRKANRDFNKKLILEIPMRRDLLKYFNKVKRIYKFGLPIPTIQPVLKNHYKRVAKKLLVIPKKEIDQDREKIKAAVLAFLSGMPEKQASIIDANTRKKVLQATQHLIDSGVTNPTRSDVANVMTRLNKGRITSIATTETQFSYEGSKNVIINESHNILEDTIVDQDEKRSRKIAAIAGDWESAQVVKGIGDGIAAGALFAVLANAVKTWFDMDDKRVRPWHKAARGQTVPRNQPFIVKGELLMYPGDMSLGASLDNTVRCRCVAA